MLDCCPPTRAWIWQQSPRLFRVSFVVLRRTNRSRSRASPIKFGQILFNAATELMPNSERLTSQNELVAVGSHPLVPQVEGLEGT
jgi:hypothetical protein